MSPIEQPDQWRMRKKFTLALLLYVSGTALAFYTGASLGAYTAYAIMLLGVFGASDLVDKKVENQ